MQFMQNRKWGSSLLSSLSLFISQNTHTLIYLLSFFTKPTPPPGTFITAATPPPPTASTGSSHRRQPPPTSGGHRYSTFHPIQTTLLILKPPDLDTDNDKLQFLQVVSRRKKRSSWGWRQLKRLIFMTSCIIPQLHLALLPMSPAGDIIAGLGIFGGVCHGLAGSCNLLLTFIILLVYYTYHLNNLAFRYRYCKWSYWRCLLAWF